MLEEEKPESMIAFELIEFCLTMVGTAWTDCVWEWAIPQILGETIGLRLTSHFG